jgi:hypothetical protein
MEDGDIYIYMLSSSETHKTSPKGYLLPKWQSKATRVLGYPSSPLPLRDAEGFPEKGSYPHGKARQLACLAI